MLHLTACDVAAVPILMACFSIFHVALFDNLDLLSFVSRFTANQKRKMRSHRSTSGRLSRLVVDSSNCPPLWGCFCIRNRLRVKQRWKINKRTLPFVCFGRFRRAERSCVHRQNVAFPFLLSCKFDLSINRAFWRTRGQLYLLSLFIFTFTWFDRIPRLRSALLPPNLKQNPLLSGCCPKIQHTQHVNYLLLRRSSNIVSYKTSNVKV